MMICQGCDKDIPTNQVQLTDTMHRVIQTLFLAAISLSLQAQTIKVKSVEVVTNDIEARTNPKQDNNGDFCALLKIGIPSLRDISFTGWVTHVIYTPGEYKVYVPKGTKRIKFNHEKYTPGEIVLPEPAREKTVYKVTLELPTTKKVHVTDANAKIEEARNLFMQRKYKDAKVAYEGAWQARDITSEQRQLVENSLSLCDSCQHFTRIVNGAYKEMKAKQTMDQQEAAEYADIAINGMRHLYFLNPSEFYERKIKELETFVRDIPLSVRFTVVSWIKTVAGMQEGAPMPNVEAWAYYGQTSLTVAEYETDKNLQRYMKDNGSSFEKLGVSDNNGIIDVGLKRTNLPSAIIFRPIGYDKKQKNALYDMSEIMNSSAGSFSKRQQRILIYNIL